MKFIVELETTHYGRVVVEAKSRKEAREIADNSFKNYSSPEWWEGGSEMVGKTKKVISKKDRKLIKDELLPNIKI